MLAKIDHSRIGELHTAKHRKCSRWCLKAQNNESYTHIHSVEYKLSCSWFKYIRRRVLGICHQPFSNVVVITTPIIKNGLVGLLLCDNIWMILVINSATSVTIKDCYPSYSVIKSIFNGLFYTSEVYFSNTFMSYDNYYQTRLCGVLKTCYLSVSNFIIIMQFLKACSDSIFFNYIHWRLSNFPVRHRYSFINKYLIQLFIYT